MYILLMSMSTKMITMPFVDGKNITLPCIKGIISSNYPTLFNIIQTVMVGLFLYFVAVNTFSRIKSISNPKNDQIEVTKL